MLQLPLSLRQRHYITGSKIRKENAETLIFKGHPEPMQIFSTGYVHFFLGRLLSLSRVVLN